jgi:uncharacterized membrane protein YfcA
MRRSAIWLATFYAAWLGSTASAQQVADHPPPPPTPNPGSGGNLFEFFTGKTPHEFWLTVIIIMFGLTVLFLLLWALRSTPERRPEDISRALIVITVITSSLILITAGYSNEQVAPAFGIFGTIVGYMLGRMSDQGRTAPAPPQGAVPVVPPVPIVEPAPGVPSPAGPVAARGVGRSAGGQD